MSWAARRPHFGLGLGQRQIEPRFTRLALPLLCGQRRANGVLAPGFVLLRLDRFAFPAARHDLTIAETGPSDPVTFIALPVILGVVAFLAGLFPAIRATRVDPLEALRVE